MICYYKRRSGFPIESGCLPYYQVLLWLNFSSSVTEYTKFLFLMVIKNVNKFDI